MPVIPPSVRVACLSAALPRVGGLSPGHRPPALPSCSLEPWIFSPFNFSSQDCPLPHVPPFLPCHTRFQTRQRLCVSFHAVSLAWHQCRHFSHTRHTSFAQSHAPCWHFQACPLCPCHLLTILSLSFLCSVSVPPFQASLFFSALTSLACLQAVCTFCIKDI